VYDEESEEEVGLRVAATNRKEASSDLSVVGNCGDTVTYVSNFSLLLTLLLAL